MQIGISGSFQFFEVFNGTLKTTATCDLFFAKSYSLIYAEMQNLDVVALLDQAFNLGLEGASLNVTSAGFFTFSATGGGSPQATLQSIFPQSPVPASVAAVATPVTDTTAFWMTVALNGADTNNGLFFSLVDIGVSNDSQLSLSATFATGATASNAIRQATYTIALDGVINLFDIFALQNVAVSYSIANSKQLAISGTLTVSLFGSTFNFTGDIQSNSADQVVTADIAVVGNVNLSVLFDGNFPGISFTDIAFNLYYPYGSNKNAAQFMVRGNCDFAGLQFTGLLYMQSTTPVLGSVVFTQSASINTLFDQCIPGASWPSNLIDLTLLAGCQVYYNSTNGPLTLTLSNDGTAPTLLPVPSSGNGGSGTGTGSGTGVASSSADTASQVPSSPTSVTYASGFNLAASFVLTLLDEIDVAGTVVVNNKGVVASIGIADPIDIYVLSITQQGNANAGPQLSFTTSGSTGSMSFLGSLLFFQESFGVNATVTATKDAKQNLLITTTLTPTQSYPPLLSATDSLTFSYSADQGFQIQNWPTVKTAQDIIDFFKALKQLSNTKGSGCGAIADFVCSDLLGQNWNLSLSFSSTTASGLSLNLSISYELTFSGTSFATVTLPNAMVIPIPNSVSLDSDSQNYLWTVIVNALEAAAESLVQALINNPEAIAQFLVLFGGKQASQYAATLACQGVIDGAVDAAVAAGVEAAGSALGTAAVGVAAVGAGIAGFFSSHGGGGSGGGGDNDSPPTEPGNLVATVSGATVAATWWLSSGAQSYSATMTDQNGTLLGASGTLSYSATSYSFNVQPTTLPATCTIAVTASNPYGTSPAASVKITYLAAPTGLTGQLATATAPNVAMDVNWATVVGATSYVVTATGPATVSQTSATTNAVLTFAPGDPAGGYAVTVVASGGDQTVQSPASSPLLLTRIAAPTGLASQAATATAPNVAMDVSWATVPGATSYSITASGPTTISQTSATTDAVLTFGPNDPAGGYSVTVSAIGDSQTIASAPSAPLTLTRLAAPTGLTSQPATTSAPSAGVQIGWTSVAGATSYTVTASGPATISQTSATTDAMLTFGPSVPVGGYAVTVVAADGDQTIPSQPATALSLTRLAAPTGLTVSATATTITARWNTVANADSYALAWTTPGGTTGSETVAAVADATQTGVITLPTPVASGVWTITVQALPASGPGQTIAGPPSAAASVVVTAALTPAQLAQLCFAQTIGGAACGQQLIAAFPGLIAYTMAVAMSEGGYAFADTASGLQAAFPGITATQLSQALAQAYPAPTSSGALAQACHTLAVSGSVCGQQLILMYPTLTFNTLATAMAGGGYAYADTGSGLQAAFPAITAAQMSQALAQAYP